MLLTDVDARHRYPAIAIDNPCKVQVAFILLVDPSGLAADIGFDDRNSAQIENVKAMGRLCQPKAARTPAAYRTRNYKTPIARLSLQVLGSKDIRSFVDT